jgi:hypothetical protein
MTLPIGYRVKVLLTRFEKRKYVTQIKLATSVRTKLMIGPMLAGSVIARIVWVK